jgi:hypothetical protein
MNAPRYARLAGRLFVQGRHSIPPPPPAPEARARAIAAVEQAIAARRRRRHSVAWTTAFAGVAAVAAAAFIVRLELRGSHSAAHSAAAPVPQAMGDAQNAQIVAHPEGAGARIVVSGAQAPLSEGIALHSGSRVITPANGGLALRFVTGTSVVLGAWGDMTLIGDGTAQVVRVDSGSVDLHVAKLAAGQRFLVDTPDAEVEVRGTQFRVSIVPADPSCGGATWTRVAVTEGVVEVRHAGTAARVAAGEQWPSGCGEAPIARARVTPAGTTVGPQTRIDVRPRMTNRRWGESSLGAQNNLFAQAVTAKRLGDSPRALAVLERFLTKYPTSPLTENVMVERMRLLRTLDPAGAVAAATQYLALYPNGFAHAEAESMVAEAP